MSSNFNGMFRGRVVGTADKRGQCRIFVPGVYPSEFEKTPNALPPAEPAMPLFGGNASVNGGNEETGWAGWPIVGAEVWVFFNQGDHMFPVYFAACQGGDGWIAEHNQQYTLQTKSVMIRIDEDPSNEKSTAQRNSYNADCTIDNAAAASVVESNMPLRTTVELSGNFDLTIVGNANIKVTGNGYAQYDGNVHETIKGNLYRKVEGDKYEQVQGKVDEKYNDTFTIEVAKDVQETFNQNLTTNVTTNVQETIGGNVTENVTGAVTENAASKAETITGAKTQQAGTHSMTGTTSILISSPATTVN